MYTVSIFTSEKGIESRFIERSMFVSYSYLSPDTRMNGARYFLGIARSPVCVSVIFIPNRRRNTREVMRLPFLLRSGTCGREKSRAPRITRSFSESIALAQAAISSVRCCPSPSAVTHPAASGRFSRM